MQIKYRKLIFGLFLLIFIGCAFFWKYKKPYPNVLLITVDALRPDHLGCYGYPKNTSPNIDRLAKEGVMFTQAITQCSLTLSSIPSLLTSTYPSSHGIEEIKDNLNFLNPSILNLAQISKDQGYYTGAISGHGFIFSSIPGLALGFDTINEIPNVKADKITQDSIDWIRKNRGKAFFLWIHYMDPHARYEPPFPYDEIYLPTGLKEQEKNTLIKKYEWVARKWIKERIVFLPKQSIEGDMTEEDRMFYISQYDGEISFVDTQIGILLRELNKIGIDKNTLFILTADHGENLADYNKNFGHGYSLYDVEIRVPLIIKGRRIPKAKVISQQVQLIDIMPTIMDILGINKYKQRVEGESFIGIILNKKEKHGHYAFSELSNIPRNRIFKSVRTKDWKLVYDCNKNNYELYNLKYDPGERNNLVVAEKDSFEVLNQRLKDWMGRVKPLAAKATVVLDEETKEGLRSLGYLQ